VKDKTTFILLLLLLFVFPSTAMATTVTYTDSFSLASTTNSNVTDTNLAVPLFNTSLGSLTSVTIYYKLDIESQVFNVINNTNNEKNITLTTSPFIGITGNTWNVSTTPPSTTGTVYFSNAYNQSLQIKDIVKNGTAVFTFPIFNSVETLTGPSISGFTGSGVYDFEFLFKGSASVNQGSIQNATTNGLFGEVIVTYNYNPVPIPAAAWLLSSGLFGLIVIRRRKGK
jgi:hypothetical protein